MFSVVNQYGKYLDGKVRDMIIDAYRKDKTFLFIDGYRVDIIGSVSDEKGNVLIKVCYEEN